MAPGAIPSGYSPNMIPSPDSPMRFHQRAPSLGELHQELESEQEGQVNRLLGMIRQQQAQLQSLQSPTTNHPPNGEGSAIANSANPTPTSSTAATPSSLFARPTLPPRSRTPSATRLSTVPRPPTAGASSTTTYQPPGRPPPPLNRHSSSRRHLHPSDSSPQHHGASLPTTTQDHSQPHSPSSSPLPPHTVRPHTPSRTSSFEYGSAAVNVDTQMDSEIAFCRTEAASLERENRMLRARIKELQALLAANGTVVGGLNGVGGGIGQDAFANGRAIGDSDESRRGRWNT